METINRETVSEVMDNRVRGVVDRIIADARPLRIILFGSHASGTARPDSDIDLLVVMPDGTDCRAAMEEIGSRLPRPGVGIDLLVSTPATLSKHRDNPGLIYQPILSSGRDVYVAPDYKRVQVDGG